MSTCVTPLPQGITYNASMIEGSVLGGVFEAPIEDATPLFSNTTIGAMAKCCGSNQVYAENYGVGVSVLPYCALWCIIPDDMAPAAGDEEADVKWIDCLRTEGARVHSSYNDLRIVERSSAVSILRSTTLVDLVLAGVLAGMLM